MNDDRENDNALASFIFIEKKSGLYQIDENKINEQIELRNQSNPNNAINSQELNLSQKIEILIDESLFDVRSHAIKSDTTKEYIQNATIAASIDDAGTLTITSKQQELHMNATEIIEACQSDDFKSKFVQKQFNEKGKIMDINFKVDGKKHVYSLSENSDNALLHINLPPKDNPKVFTVSLNRRNNGVTFSELNNIDINDSGFKKSIQNIYIAKPTSVDVDNAETFSLFELLSKRSKKSPPSEPPSTPSTTTPPTSAETISTAALKMEIGGGHMDKDSQNLQTSPPSRPVSPNLYGQDKSPLSSPGQ